MFVGAKFISPAAAQAAQSPVYKLFDDDSGEINFAPTSWA
jgi:hypothetical protein